MGLAALQDIKPATSTHQEAGTVVHMFNRYVDKAPQWACVHHLSHAHPHTTLAPAGWQRALCFSEHPATKPYSLYSTVGHLIVFLKSDLNMPSWSTSTLTLYSMDALQDTHAHIIIIDTHRVTAAASLLLQHRGCAAGQSAFVRKHLSLPSPHKAQLQ
jgi:hypothetical protein